MFKRFLCTLGAAPTTSGHLGYTLTTSLVRVPGITSDYLPNTTGILIPSAGIWFINYSITISAPNNNGIINSIYTSIASPSIGYTTLSLGIVQTTTTQTCNNAGGISNSGSGVVNITNNSTYIYIYVNLSIGAGPINTFGTNSYMQFTRIA